MQYLLGSADPMTQYMLDFTPVVSGEYALVFSNAGNDYNGALLDNVRVTSPGAERPSDRRDPGARDVRHDGARPGIRGGHRSTPEDAA